MRIVRSRVPIRRGGSGDEPVLWGDAGAGRRGSAVPSKDRIERNRPRSVGTPAQMRVAVSAGTPFNPGGIPAIPVTGD